MLPRQMARWLRERFLGGGHPVPAGLRSKWLAAGLLLVFFFSYELFSRVQSLSSPPKLLHLFGDNVTGLRAGALISQRQFRQDFHDSYSIYQDRIDESHKKPPFCQRDMGDCTISPDLLTVFMVLMPTRPENRIKMAFCCDIYQGDKGDCTLLNRASQGELSCRFR
jgi:hypothetical protein